MHLAVAPLLLALAAQLPAADPSRDSPHFVVSGDPSLDQLPLEHTTARFRVSGVVASVELHQSYRNAGSRPIEAIYVFPMSTRAAVHGMRMRIGDRIIRAEIRERKDARDAYDAAKDQGQAASLLEAQRPNVLQMSVANILPGDRVEVFVDYVEVTNLSEGEYELVLPTVVGPRYTGGSPKAAPGDRSLTTPRVSPGTATHTLEISAHISAGVPIAKLESPSHRVVTVMAPRGRLDQAEVTLAEPTGANRDFVLRYRLAGATPTSGVLLHEGGDEQFFLAMLQPPARVEPTSIPPRELVFIVDVSCSMQGFPLDVAKTLVDGSLAALRPQDRFNLMLFAGGSRVLAEESVRASPENLRQARQMLHTEHGGGSTEIRAALQRALALPRDPEVSTSFVVITDGYVAVERETFSLIRSSLGRANLFAFGIGTSVNRHLIEGMARAGMGEPIVVQGETEARSAASRLSKLLDAPVLTRVKVDFDGFEAYDVVPAALPDLFMDRPLLVFGKFRGPARGHIRLEGHSPAGRYSQAIDVARASDGQLAHEALRLFWAREAIRGLEDSTQESGASTHRERIVELGLRHGLLTEHTSFVAIDSAKRNHDGTLMTVEQPLAVPSGVGMGALGGLGARGLGSGGGGLALRGVGRGHSAMGKQPSGRTTPSVAAGKTVVLGSLDKQSIARILAPALQRVRHSYERASLRLPGLAGRVVVRLTVSAEGRVESVEFVESSLSDPRLQREIFLHFKGLTFPGGHGVLSITYPMVLKAAP